MSILNSSFRFLVLGVVALTAVTLGSSSSKAEFTKVIETGHVDLNGFFEDGTLKMNVRLSASEFYDPATTLIKINHSVVRPTSGLGSGSDFDFLGVAPGEDIWVSPTNINTGLFGGVDVPELGFRNSYRVAQGGVNPMRFEFDRSAFTGPGQFSLFSDIGTLFMSSHVAADDFVNVPTHSHFNWGFSRAGRYTLTLRATGTREDGSIVSGEWTTFNIQVVPEPSSLALMGLGAGVFGLALRRRIRRAPVEA